MSVHSTITASGVWPADLEDAGVVSAAAAVYTGRAKQQVQRTTEVWLEALPTEPLGQGLQARTRHPYLVHVYRHGNDGPGQRGERNLTAVEGALDTIRKRYQGACPFKSSVPGMVHAEASIEEIDEDPESGTYQEGTVRVVFTVAE